MRSSSQRDKNLAQGERSINLSINPTYLLYLLIYFTYVFTYLLTLLTYCTVDGGKTLAGLPSLPYLTASSHSFFWDWYGKGVGMEWNAIEVGWMGI